MSTLSRFAPNLGAYRQIISLWIQTSYAYRVDLATELAGLLLQIYLLRAVWTAVYAGRMSVDGIPLDQVISMVTLASLQVWFTFPMATWYLRNRIREGLIALDLARPVPFLSQMAAHQLGATASVVPFLILTLPVALLVGGLQLPITPLAGLLYLLSFVLGYLISCLIGLLIGMIAFWTLEAGEVQTIYVFLSQFFSGALVPIWFFPDWLLTIGNLLPFQGQAYLPLAIYLGTLTGSAALSAIGLQLFWVLALGLFAWLVWQRAMRRVVVQGG
jgi:ABC-2 type transport system permease protein